MIVPEYIWQLIFKINRDKRRRLDYNKAWNHMNKITISRLTFMSVDLDWDTVLFMDFSETKSQWKTRWSTVSLSTTRRIRAQAAISEARKALFSLKEA